MAILWLIACLALSVTVSDAYTPFDGPKGAVLIVYVCTQLLLYTWHMNVQCQLL